MKDMALQFGGRQGPSGRRAVAGQVVGVAIAALAAQGLAAPAAAQTGLRGSIGPQQPISRDQPVTFTADRVEYNRDTGIVTATGHVEAWQNDHILRADRITFDRNTNVAAASGNVVLVDPSGQVAFAEYAELTQGMRDGVLRGMRAILAENGKLAANGARRTEGQLNELSRAVYSTCNLCARDPAKPPLWQLRAYSAVQDVENKRIEYEDAVLEMYGVPVFYLPYFSHPDPSAKRESGFLVPSIGNDSHLGQFFSTPYYLVIDKDSDATITPLLATRSGPQISLDYREKFNNGSLKLDGSVAYAETAMQGHLFTKGPFAYDDTWRYGFDINVASSARYLQRLPLPGATGGRRADQPDLRRGIRPGRLYQARRALLSGADQRGGGRQAALRAAALPVQLFRPAGPARRPAFGGCRRLQRAAPARHQRRARQPQRELGAAGDRRVRRAVQADPARRHRGLQRLRPQPAAEFRHRRPVHHRPGAADRGAGSPLAAAAR